MPYRHAWLFVVALIAATPLAFWPGYFSRLSEAQIAWHLHAVTASCWMLLLAAQSWTVHNGGRALHRSLGLATFVAVPLFVAGGLAVMQSMARATIGGDPFYAIYGARLASYDGLATITFLWLTAMALKERRNVQLHARYMLATPLLLLSPVTGRLTGHFLPGLIIEGPQDFGLFAWNVHLGSLFALLIAALLYAAKPRFGRPWLVVAIVVVVQSIVFETLARGAAWRALFLALASVPTPVLLGFGLVVGGAAMGLGWSAAPARRRATATA